MLVMGPNPFCGLPRRFGFVSLIAARCICVHMQSCNKNFAESLFGYMGLSFRSPVYEQAKGKENSRKNPEGIFVYNRERSKGRTPPTINKTRRRRLVPVSPNLRAWMEKWLSLDVPLAPPGWDNRLLRVRRAAGLDPWPQNVLRHSRVSYRLAQTGNAAQTAIEDGHSEAILHAHYSALVTPEDAARYFGILPWISVAQINPA